MGLYLRLYKKIDIIVREMDVCQDKKMHVGCNLALCISQRKAAHSGAPPVCGGPD